MTAGWSPVENHQLTGGRPHIQPEVLQLPVGALQDAVVVLHGEEFAPLNDVKLQGVPWKSKHHPLSLALFKLTWRMWIWDVNVMLSAHDRLDLIKRLEKAHSFRKIPLGWMTTMFPEAAPYPPPAAGHWVQMILPWAHVMAQCHQPGPLWIQRVEAGWRKACSLKVNQPNQQNTQIKIPG